MSSVPDTCAQPRVSARPAGTRTVWVVVADPSLTATVYVPSACSSTDTSAMPVTLTVRAPRLGLRAGRHGAPRRTAGPGARHWRGNRVRPRHRRRPTISPAPPGPPGGERVRHLRHSRQHLAGQALLARGLVG